MFFSGSKDRSDDKSSHRVGTASGAFLALTVGATALLAVGCAASMSSATARNAAGVECFSAGRYDDAIAYFQESLEDNPSNAEAYYNLGSAYQRKATETGDTVLLGQAEDAYWTALENNPSSETIVCCYRGLATSAMARGDGAGALQTLEAWRDRNPDSIEPKLEIAYLLEAQQKDSEAYDVLKQVAAEAPNDYRAYYKMGVLAERAGDLTDAMENAETAHKLNPSDALVSQRMNSLEAQYAAKQRSEKATDQKTAIAKAEFSTPAASMEALPVQTAPVQTTSAKAQENDEAQPAELTLPDETPVPTTNFRPIPTIESRVSQDVRPNAQTSAQTSAPQVAGQDVQIASDVKSSAALGFGAPVSSGGQTTASAGGNRRTTRARDDSDVKWISSSNADRVRRQIAQTSATAPQDDSNASGFAVVSSDGTGSASQRLPNKTITTAQFETPAFAANVSQNASPNATTEQPAATAEAPKVALAAPTQEPPPKTSEPVKPRAELHSGPPRVSAGSFF